MCLEAQIRALAAEGKSRKQAALILGLSTGKMQMISDSLTGLSWQRANYTNGRRLVGQDAAVGEHARRTRVQRNTPGRRQETFILNGIEGTLIDLMVHFKVMWTIGTVRKRLAKGMPLDEAFSSGRPKLRDWSECAWQ